MKNQLKVILVAIATAASYYIILFSVIDNFKVKGNGDGETEKLLGALLGVPVLQLVIGIGLKSGGFTGYLKGISIGIAIEFCLVLLFIIRMSYAAMNRSFF